jgi:hypothetical protein
MRSNATMAGDEVTQIDKVISDWQTQTGEGHPYGLTFEQMGDLARVAVRGQPDTTEE